MKELNDGGPAFPGEQGHTPDGSWNQTWESGMSLRDWFAGTLPDPFAAVNSPGTAAGMSGLECPSLTADQAEWNRFWIEAEAKVRYMKADAMLKAREVKP